MSTEEVTVSLSRLALAKAIKTPDAGEEEAEPWSKSIIFHQSHIDSQMRKSIINPSSSQHNKRRPGQRHQQQPLLHKNQKQQRYPGGHMDRSRPDELHQQHSSNSRYNNQQQQHQQQYPSQIQQQQQQFTQVNSKTNGNTGHTNTTITKSAGTKQGRNIAPSDDEEEEEEEDDDVEDDEEDDDDEEEEEDDQYKKEEIKINDTKKKSQNNLPQRKISEVDSKHEIKVAQQSTVKGKARLQQPSDDEDEEESEEDSEEDSDGDDEKENESDKDSLENGYEATNALAAEEIQQTYARRMSTLRQLEKGTTDSRRRSRSLSDMGQFSLPLVAEMHEQDISPNSINAVEAWQNTIIEAENINGSSASDLGSSALNSTEGGETIEEPIVSTDILPQSKVDYRMSTLGEMDFYKYQQQQQQQQQQMAFHNMQMQQAMQMAQIQQYQQAMQMQQQMMSNYDPRMMNRQSVSAMDLMMQMEQEKSSSRKKKPINGSNASLNDGLLGRVPEQRHNISFQGQMISHSNGKRSTMTHASKSDHNIRENNKNRNSSRPPSSMAMYYDNNRAGSSMGMVDPRYYSQMGRNESPMPTLSFSTPLQPMMGQYASPNSGRGGGKSRQSQQPIMGMPPMMVPSRSTGGSSHQPSSRQSTNWGTKNRERIR